ncbi:squalene--hopene cyclase [Streptomyces johnsoniae]|uniref:Squalene--hopene cyclase n=1 Tax=Streptomyces johnsoniae TaxID=3075532 RepID=A0ABU2S836_9ACTN|nr:squalene--hopene cyclase [Streptomyces sp. DSM 41886]MDT0444574.1 squalene--hopene cyclase [Streptomyces sp. DSM 41886]
MNDIHADDTLARGIDNLLARQLDDGHWYEGPHTNVSAESADIIARHCLGITDTAALERTALRVRRGQHDDGSWPMFPGGPGHLSVTAEAYLALRLAGDPPDEPHMRSAARFCRRHGGLGAARTETHFWLAVLGIRAWDRVPPILPEQILFPAGTPVAVRSLGVWSRHLLTPLSVIAAQRPIWPAGFDLPELYDPTSPAETAPPGKAERVMRAYHKHPLRPLRGRALARAELWLLRNQQANGSWFHVFLFTALGTLALKALGYTTDNNAYRSALAALDGFGAPVETPDGAARRIVPCPGPVWDTAYSLLALLDAGVKPTHPAIERACTWLIAQQSTSGGDWQRDRPRVPPGGWPFSPGLNNYPDLDDTAIAITALTRLRDSNGQLPPAVAPAVERGQAWLAGLQSRKGGWAAYESGDLSPLTELSQRLPYNDHGPMLDVPTADVTGHVLEALTAAAPEGGARRPSAAAEWLLAQQEPDGSWFGRWGVNHIYGTGSAVPGLVAAGISPGDPHIRRATDWLRQHQNADGGWGEDCRSYDDPAHRGRGRSTPSQTAWALLALHAAGVGADDKQVRAAFTWLADHQRPDGSWDEEVFTATGQPGEIYFAYPAIVQAMPVIALGRYLAPTQPPGQPDPPHPRLTAEQGSGHGTA